MFTIKKVAKHFGFGGEYYVVNLKVNDDVAGPMRAISVGARIIQASNGKCCKTWIVGRRWNFDLFSPKPRTTITDKTWATMCAMKYARKYREKVLAANIPTHKQSVKITSTPGSNSGKFFKKYKSKSNTGIVIEGKRIIERGEAKIKITKLKALPWEKLPMEYTTGTPMAYLNKDGALEYCSAGTALTAISVGDTMDMLRFETVCTILRYAGERLMWINKMLKERYKGWKNDGKITVKI